MQGWSSGWVKFQTELRKSELSSPVVPVGDVSFAYVSVVVGLMCKPTG